MVACQSHLYMTFLKRYFAGKLVARSPMNLELTSMEMLLRNTELQFQVDRIKIE